MCASFTKPPFRLLPNVGTAFNPASSSLPNALPSSNLNPHHGENQFSVCAPVSPLLACPDTPATVGIKVFELPAVLMEAAQEALRRTSSRQLPMVPPHAQAYVGAGFSVSPHSRLRRFTYHAIKSGASGQDPPAAQNRPAPRTLSVSQTSNFWARAAWGPYIVQLIRS